MAEVTDTTTTLTVEDVCNFLRSRDVTNTVVDFFRKQKIDGKVVGLLSDSKLIEYGLVTIGDRITLREICRTVSSQAPVTSSEVDSDTGLHMGKYRKRKELLDLLRQNDSRDNKYRNKMKISRGRPKNASRTVTFGLRILKKSKDDNERQSSIVKSPLGDKNTIAVKVQIQSNYDEILKVAHDIFFPSGENPVIGAADDFFLEIVNTRNCNIEAGIAPFTFGEYMERKKVPGTPKLFLLCSPFDNEELEKSIFAIEEQQTDDTITGTTATNSTDDILEETDQHDYITLTETSENVHLVTEQNEDSYILPQLNYDFQASSPSREVFLRKPITQNKGPVNIGISDEINTIVELCVDEINLKKIYDPVEILRYYQTQIVTGRPLDVQDEATALKGETNFIMVDRSNIVQTGFDEIRSIENLRTTLEVQFYGEMAEDLGGPRKEFFSMVLQGIQQEYFDPIREWSNDYDVIGKIFALSILQNGKLPRILEPEDIENVFSENSTDKPYITQLRLGLNTLGLYKLTCRVPAMRHLFTPVESPAINLKSLTQMLKPVFSPEGSNQRREESSMYSIFIQYLREVASGRRANINLVNVLKFITGCEEEPVLGFSIQPTIHFSKDSGILPTANTCINKLNFPLFDTLPEDKEVHRRFDYAFSNSYFGMI